MGILSSRVSPRSETFALNQAAYAERIANLHARRVEARAGGPEKMRAKHLARNKVLPRHRIELLMDPGSPFLELGELTGDGRYEGVPPGAGIITGVGLVSGRPCMIIANDATVKGGTYFGLTCKKHVRAQAFAWQHRLPCITLVDSGGAFLPDQANIFPDDGQFGSIFHNQVGMSGDGIPQIAVVMGPCTAGGAYIPALCDEVVIVRGQGFMYLGGPELTFAATGETVDAESLGGAAMHCSKSGVTDHIAEDDRHALLIARNIVRELGQVPPSRRKQEPSRPPRFDTAEIYGIISRDPKYPTDTREILARLVDDSEFQEFKPLYGETLLTGFARIHGYEIGILANNGVLFPDSAMKGTHFINLCCQRDVPLLFMSDVTGFMVGQDVEQAGIAKHGAKMITAMSSARVPKYTLNIGASYGAGYLAMCGRAFKPTAMFAWPNGRSGIMGPEQAAMVLSLVRETNLKIEKKTWTEEEREAFKAPVRKIYEDLQGAHNFAAHGWIDGVIEPLETRGTLALLLELAARVPAQKTQFGVFRF
ncbi:carboxyl transferase domain-containing protein [Nevskia sp.]|uniref:acyl-CoA carboxylase subunit beta n=1 Tax=Nevskia sp. TaxID=1929292 RepID=UPI0025D46390|nr:carboxyl transferase domain-containing protein [Nevskia sp.]